MQSKHEIKTTQYESGPISHTVQPAQKPDFNSWANYIHTTIRQEALPIGFTQKNRPT